MFDLRDGRILFDIKSSLSPFLQAHVTEIQSLCEQHQVHKLWAFGSVLKKDFHPDSDVDLLYEMEKRVVSPDDWYVAYWEFLDRLVTVLDRKVDLIWHQGIKNPYLKAEIEANKVLLYDRQRKEIFV
ncbi:MAG: nucleotidyltransferase domain-containing protein [Bacteroidota bacterium]